MTTHQKTVVVGMSGGVDSSVSALLLKQQGYRVIGLFMRNWDEQDSSGHCQATADYDDVTAICHQLEIPHYAVNFTQDYWDRVFESFLADLKKGYTPNPDILCNREIKFSCLLDQASQLGADYLATGHYCRILQTQDRYLLARGSDPQKDQSYFLYTLKEKKLPYLLFPVGDLLKSQVRQLATAHGLVTAAKKDSTGICFIGKRDFKSFVSQYLGYQPGNFETLDGRIVGKHDGIAYYTIGQRRGLAIGGAGEAWFVVGKEVERNVVRVVQGESHPALYGDRLTATEISWVNEPPVLPLRCTAKIRYRQPDAACTIVSCADDRLEVHFDNPQKAITPRQSIVFYSGPQCLGGAIISPSTG